jgi:hypothetical protein
MRLHNLLQQDSRAVFWRIHDAGQYLLKVSDPEGYAESLSRECNSRAHRTQSDPVGAFGQARADQRDNRQLLQGLLVRAHWRGAALRAVDSFNSLVEAYTHDSNNNLVIGGSTPVGDTKRPPTPPPHLPALKAEEIGGTSLPRCGRERWGSRPLCREGRSPGPAPR